VTALTWYELSFPREVTYEVVVNAYRFLAAAGGVPVIFEAEGTAAGVTHRIALPRGRASSVAAQLRRHVAGLDLELVARTTFPARRAIAIGLSTKRRQLRADIAESAARSLLSALTHVASGERLLLQWFLVREQVPKSVPNKLRGIGAERLSAQLIFATLGHDDETDSELRNAIREKQSEFGWRGTGRIGVVARSRSRQRQLIRQVLGALRSAEAAGVGFRASSRRAAVIREVSSPWFATLYLNALELGAVSSWPIGATSELPVTHTGSVNLLPPAGTPVRGRILGDSIGSNPKPIALGTRDSLTHLHVIGPTGSGKSTLLCNLIVQDMEAGRGVVVIEPKGDLIEDVLARIPPDRVDDVVILDPNDLERPVGLNPLALHGASPELVADQVLGVLHSIYASSWGPRTSDILSNALLTLARSPRASLVALPLILTDSGFRRKLTRNLSDPIALGPFWEQFEAWSEAERAAAIAPSLNKLRPFLLRPELRGVLGQTDPRLQLREVFTERRILLVNLAKGLLGPESSALLGALVVSQLWQVILGRSKIAPERRHPVFLYVDEFQDYLKLPVDFADALAQSRGLGVGLVLAHQYLRQLDNSIRSAVLNNAQSRVAFRLGKEDAPVFAVTSAPSEDDFAELPPYEAYVRLMHGGAPSRWMSLRSRALPPVTSEPQRVRRRSAEAFGVPRAELEQAIRELLDEPHRDDARDIGRRRRNGGSL
jgi:hypothetical protein